ncbi:universal stress protein [Geomesophilobacter sediminis]|uniref:Universal stress protein n=1 Tax=Geomesophilobacter sediminis TaxID=2798584 RepID=A0A8J7LTV4_9BACT|nr:universal stress protein [Geomesophilobacter sediminis]MBJ6723839.1 universal stress protein [Geomesophilobacter sediminis]
MDDLKNILIVSRMTPYCREAVEMGLMFAKRFQARLFVLYIPKFIVDMEAVNAPDLSLDKDAKTYRTVQEQAKEELDKALRADLTSDVPVKTMVRNGSPVEEIAKVVKEEQIDLMIMVANQEGRLEHLLFGQESDAIIRSLPCSTLLVKKDFTERRW